MTRYIDTIALCLCEDMAGANGDLTPHEIKVRLSENIRERLNYPAGEMITIWQAADLLISLWGHMEDQENQLITEMLTDRTEASRRAREAT